MDKFNLDKVIKAIEQQKRELPILLGNDTKNYFLSSWNKKRWGNENWPEVQRRIAGTKAYQSASKSARTRSILVQSGRLRRDVANSLRVATWDKIQFSVQNPYAAIHNYGGTIEKKERLHKLSFNEKGKWTKTRTEKQRKKVAFTRVAAIGGHGIQIPKRQFIGQTGELTQKQTKLIMRQMAKIWQA